MSYPALNSQSLNRFLEPQRFISLICDGISLINPNLTLKKEERDRCSFNPTRRTRGGRNVWDLRFQGPKATTAPVSLGRLPVLDEWGIYTTGSAANPNQWVVLSELLVDAKKDLICLPIGERLSACFLARCSRLSRSPQAQGLKDVDEVLQYFAKVSGSGIFTEIFQRSYGYPNYYLARRLDSENQLEKITLSRRLVLARPESYQELSIIEDDNQTAKILVWGKEYFVTPISKHRSLNEEIQQRLDAVKLYRIDPIDTPGGQVAGTIFTLPFFAEVDETGTIRTHYRQIDSDKDVYVPFDEYESICKASQDGNALYYLSAENERNLYICPKCESVNIFGVGEKIECRNCRSECEPAWIKFIDGGCHRDEQIKSDSKGHLIAFEDISRAQQFGPCLALVPFLNCNDGVRAQMGANALRHATPPETRSKSEFPSLVNPELPFVRTGREEEIANMFDVKVSELCPGNNLIVAFLPWYGWNFEDGIVISQEVIDKEILTYQEEKKWNIFYHPGEAPLDENFFTYIIAKEKKNREEQLFWNISQKIPLGKNGLPLEGAFLDLKEGDIYGFKRSGTSLKLLRTTFPVRGVVSYEPIPEAGHSRVMRLKLKRPLAVGDKIANRHGNKGVITRIEETEKMPFFMLGEEKVRVQVLLNPFGVVSRRNIGQILETNLGLCALLSPKSKEARNNKVEDYPAGETSNRVREQLQAYYPEWEKTVNRSDLLKELFGDVDDNSIKRGQDGYVSLVIPRRDGREAVLAEKVTVGYHYFVRLSEHDADKKLNARSSGVQVADRMPYDRVNAQPVGGRRQHGGQRFGEMETWALEGYGPTGLHLLYEILGARSDLFAGENLSQRRLINQDLDIRISDEPAVAAAWRALFYYLLTAGIKLEMVSSNGERLPWPEEDVELEQVKTVKLIHQTLSTPDDIASFFVTDKNNALITNPALPKKRFKEIQEDTEDFSHSLFSPEVFCGESAKAKNIEILLQSRKNGIGYIALNAPIPNPLAVECWARKLKVSSWRLVDIFSGQRIPDEKKTDELNSLLERYGTDLKAILQGEVGISDEEYRRHLIKVVPVMPPVYRWPRKENGELNFPAINLILSRILWTNERLGKICGFEKLARRLVRNSKGDAPKLSDEELGKLKNLISELDTYKIKLGVPGYNWEWFAQHYRRYADIAEFQKLQDAPSDEIEQIKAKHINYLYYWFEKLLANRGDKPLKIGRNIIHPKPISSMIFAKKGILRSAILGKRIDFSGRAVITVDPDIPLDACGLPALQALRMFREHVIQRLKGKGHKDASDTVKRLCQKSPLELEHLQKLAASDIDGDTDEHKNLVEFAKRVVAEWNETLKELENLLTTEEDEAGFLVLLNRQPSLTRDSVHAFKPTIHDKNTISINPLVTGLFSADFDGDQMACYPVLSRANRLHAQQLIPSFSIKSLSNGNDILNLGMDIKFGATKSMETITPSRWEEYFTAATELGISVGVIDILEDKSLAENPIYKIINSGAKGKPQHFEAIFGRSMDGSACDDGESLQGGLAAGHHFANCRNALENVMNQALGTSEPGALCRRLVLAARNLKVVSSDDCQSTGIPINPSQYDLEMLRKLLKYRFFRMKEGLCALLPEDTQILQEFEEMGVRRLSEPPQEELHLLSPLTCKADGGLCPVCVGLNLSSGKLWQKGAAIGVNSALSISERMTQLIIDAAKHGSRFPIADAKAYFRKPPADFAGAIEGYNLFNHEVALVHFETILKALNGQEPRNAIHQRGNILERMAAWVSNNHQQSLLKLYDEVAESADGLIDVLSSATSTLMIKLRGND